MSYCLLGLFDVAMPLLYGEGTKAFMRLQEEIMKTTNDESMFAWSDQSLVRSGLLAESPSLFRESGNGLFPNRRISKDSYVHYEVNDFRQALSSIIPNSNTSGPPTTLHQLFPSFPNVEFAICRSCRSRLYQRGRLKTSHLAFDQQRRRRRKKDRH